MDGALGVSVAAGAAVVAAVVAALVAPLVAVPAPAPPVAGTVPGAGERTMTASAKQTLPLLLLLFTMVRLMPLASLMTRVCVKFVPRIAPTPVHSAKTVTRAPVARPATVADEPVVVVVPPDEPPLLAVAVAAAVGLGAIVAVAAVVGAAVADELLELLELELLELLELLLLAFPPVTAMPLVAPKPHMIVLARSRYVVECPSELMVMLRPGE